MPNPTIDRIVHQLRAAELQVGRALLKVRTAPGDFGFRRELNRWIRKVELFTNQLEGCLSI